MDDDHRGHRTGLVGALLTLVGGALLLERANVLEFEAAGAWWPVLVIGLGVGRLFGSQADVASGLGLIATGAWLLAVTVTPLTFRATWPVLLVFWGLLIMTRGSRHHPRHRREEASEDRDVR